MLTVLQDKALTYEVLRYLRDVAVDVNIREKFENLDAYKVSLLRDYSSEKTLKEARLILEERVLRDAFSFDYRFTMPYNQQIKAQWHIDIDYNPKPFKRIFGLIGENGVGKTSMLRRFTKDFMAKENKGFHTKPLFNSLTVIGSVVSDKYLAFQPNNVVPYIYYHLDQNQENVQTEPYSEKRYILNEDILKSFLELLSSGQLHIFTMATFLIADMHLSSLVIIDEPEVHLHPSSIIEFMYFLYTLLQIFDSYAIIATHSPLIIREMLNTNVYKIIRTKEDIPMVSRIDFDTFGEDIAVLYNKIFGYNN